MGPAKINTIICNTVPGDRELQQYIDNTPRYY